MMQEIARRPAPPSPAVKKIGIIGLGCFSALGGRDRGVVKNAQAAAHGCSPPWRIGSPGPFFDGYLDDLPLFLRFFLNNSGLDLAVGFIQASLLSAEIKLAQACFNLERFPARMEAQNPRAP